MSNNVFRGVAGIAMALGLSSALFACGSATNEPALEIGAPGDSKVTVTATGARTGDAASTGITVGEGESVVIETALSGGSLHVSLYPYDEGGDGDGEQAGGKRGDIMFDEELSLATTRVCEAKPGRYLVFVTGGDDGDATTDGTVTLSSTDSDEAAKKKAEAEEREAAEAEGDVVGKVIDEVVAKVGAEEEKGE